MAVTGVLRPGYVQLRVLDLEEAILHYRDRSGINLVSVEGGRAFFQAFDEFDRHSIILCEGDTAGLDRMGFKVAKDAELRSEAHTSEHQSIMRIPYDVFGSEDKKNARPQRTT